MSFLSIKSMDSAGDLLGLIGKKQKVLGDNLANLATPDYTRKDIDYGETLAWSGVSKLETKMSAKYGSSFSQVSDTGEAVNPADELTQLNKNSLLYTMATRQMSSVITEMKTVINLGK